MSLDLFLSHYLFLI